MPQKIGFVGVESEDLVLYLACALTACGRRVAIEDRTEHSMLLRILEAEQRTDRRKEAQEVWYQNVLVTNTLVSGEEYDDIILNFGYRILHPKLYECEIVILVTDGLPAHAALLREMEQWERRQCLLFRNLVDIRYGEGYLEKLTGQLSEQILFLPWNEKDLRARYELGQEEKMKIAGLSREMRTLLQKLVAFVIPDLTEEKRKQWGRKSVAWEN